MAFKFGKDGGVPGHERRMAALEMQRKMQEESVTGAAEAVGLGLSIAGAIAGGIMTGTPQGAMAGWKGGEALGGLGKAAVAPSQGEAAQHLKGAISSGVGAAKDIKGIEGGEDVETEHDRFMRALDEDDEDFLADFRARRAKEKSTR